MAGSYNVALLSDAPLISLVTDSRSALVVATSRVCSVSRDERPTDERSGVHDHEVWSRVGINDGRYFIDEIYYRLIPTPVTRRRHTLR
jgi:hypothetical protein